MAPGASRDARLSGRSDHNGSAPRWAKSLCGLPASTDRSPLLQRIDLAPRIADGAQHFGGILAGFGRERGKPAASVEMRIVEQLFRLDDRRVWQTIRLEPFLQLAHGVAAKHLLQPRNEPVARQDPLVVGGDARIARELVEPE